MSDRQDEHLRTRWTSFAGMFGEDLKEPEFQDQPAPPGPRSSATRHAQHRRENDAAAAMARVDDVIDDAARVEGDKAAYERAMDLRLAGKPVNAADKVRAARYARAAGIVTPKSSAERIAAQARSRRQFQPFEQDDDRRQGRRPRR